MTGSNGNGPHVSLIVPTTKRKAGRPASKYPPKVLNQFADDLISFMSNEKNFWLKDFAISKRFPAIYLDDFAAQNPKFGAALKMAKDIQESRLVKIGLSKAYNAAMAIFALKNVAGWRDVTEVTGPDGGPIQYQEMREQLSIRINKLAEAQNN